MIKFILPAFLALLCLGACATATPYQAATNSNGGYQDQQIESNRWAISFSGNSLTDRQTVETYLLYRAADLTSENGFDHFQIVTRQTDAQSSFISNSFSTPFFYNFYGRGAHLGFGRTRFRSVRSSAFRGRRFGTFGFQDPFLTSPSVFQEQVNYEATAEIVMRKGEKPDDADYFDAEDVLINLSNAIILPKTS